MSRIDTVLINVMLAMTSCPGGSQKEAGDHREESGYGGAETEEPADAGHNSKADQYTHDKVRRTED